MRASSIVKGALLMDFERNLPTTVVVARLTMTELVMKIVG